MTDIEPGVQSFQGMRSLAPANWVVRHGTRMMFAAPKSKLAVRWLGEHLGATDPEWSGSMKDAIDHGWQVTRSYWAKSYYDGFAAEWEIEVPQFDQACEQMRGWIHRMWQQDVENHPGPAGRYAAQQRWKDADALIHSAALTLQPDPVFHYNMGPLSPPEGKGHRLHLMIRPLTMEELKLLVVHHV